MLDSLSADTSIGAGYFIQVISEVRNARSGKSKKGLKFRGFLSAGTAKIPNFLEDLALVFEIIHVIESR